MSNENQQQNQPDNPFAMAKSDSTGAGAALQLAQSREGQSIQAQLVIAKKFPRNGNDAFQRTMNDCKRLTLAQEALYSYRKGGTAIEGPSIRLAECIATNWGNMNYGVTVLESHAGWSICQAYAWDLETNTRREMIWRVDHVIKSHDTFKELSDPRDIYELIANQGSRRVRNCILGVVPGDLVDAAVEQVNNTLRSASKGVPINERIRKMVSVFNEVGVTLIMLEKKIAHKIEACSEAELIRLGKIYTTLKDGAADISDHFDVEGQAVAKPAGGEKKEEKQPPAANSPENKQPEPEKTDEPPPAEEPQEPEKKEEPAKQEEKKPAEPSKQEPPPRKQYEPVDPAKAKDERNDNLVLLGQRVTESGITPEQLVAYVTSKGREDGKPLIKAAKKFENLISFPSILVWILNNWNVGADIETQIKAEKK